MSEQTAKITPSGPDGKNPVTAAPGPTHVEGNTPENRKSQLNPSAPNDVNITPGTDYEQPAHSSRDEKA